MQTAFLESLVNRRHTVLGRALHDFCLYDALFLEIAENPLWLGGRAPTIEDLIEAVNICSLPPERLLQAEPGPRTWREALRHFWWLRGNVRADNRDRDFFERELVKFAAFIADSNAAPKMWDAQSGGRTIRAPWILSIANYVEMHSNMSEREIFTAPLGKILWKAEAIAERKGEALAEMMTQEEIEIGEEQRAAMAANGEEFPETDDDDDDGDLPLNTQHSTLN